MKKFWGGYGHFKIGNKKYVLIASHSKHQDTITLNAIHKVLSEVRVLFKEKFMSQVMKLGNESFNGPI